MDGLPEQWQTPHDGLGIQGLPDAVDMTEAGEVIAFENLTTRLHQHANCCRRRVPYRDLVFLNQIVPHVGTETPFVNELGNPVAPGGKHSIRRTGDPAGVGRAPVDVVVMQIEHPFSGRVLLNNSKVTVGRALGLACCPGGVVHDGIVVHTCPGNLKL